LTLGVIGLSMSMSMSIKKKLTSLEQQNYYEVHEGAVKSYKNYVRLRPTKKEYFKTLTGHTGRDADDWMSDGNELHCR